jgi:4-hydroxyphenylpyruvate dioxygenase
MVGILGQRLEVVPVSMSHMPSRASNSSIKAEHAEIESARIARRNVLVDGDDQGYLLQIFTRNLIGPIFIELIQRRNHLSFGEGNFGALFRSIERDQQRRGYLS